MKKLIKNFLTFLFSRLDDDTTSRLEKIKEFKRLFIVFFEGAYDSDPFYENGIPVKNFEINHFSFSFDEKEEMTVEIWLRRPGLLIGKGGRTYDALKEFLKDDVKEIKLKEYDIFV